MIGELDDIKTPCPAAGVSKKPCRKSFHGAKYGVTDKLLEISVVSSVPGECEVKRKRNPL